MYIQDTHAYPGDTLYCEPGVQTAPAETESAKRCYVKMIIWTEVIKSTHKIRFHIFERNFKFGCLYEVTWYKALSLQLSHKTKANFKCLLATLVCVHLAGSTWMQSVLMRTDMFIKLGLVSGCSEYCRCQSRPCGARGEGCKDRQREMKDGGPLDLCWNPVLQHSLLLYRPITK